MAGGAGVEEHSILLREPLQRVARSVYPIMGVVYDGDWAARTGEQIKSDDYTIKGVDTASRRYHALNPEGFYWRTRRSSCWSSKWPSTSAEG
jgi:uncharacterized protein (DUF2236 family)